MPTTMQKYLFKANAIALRGRITKPYYQELGDHLAVSTYAGSSCRHECRSAAFQIGQEVRYDSARTEIIAGQDGDIFRTSLTAQVFGLRVGTRLTVEEVTCRLESVYDSRNFPRDHFPRISPAGSTIRDLRIDGTVQKLVFPPAFNPEPARPPEMPVPGFIPDGIRVADFGTVYYAEWTWVHPQEQFQQHLTMLRLALGSDFGAAICVAIGGSDGAGWPPGN